LGDNDAESCCPQTVCFSELQYANLTIEGHEGVVTALKDPGAEISLVKAELVQDKNLPPAGSLVIRGVIGEPLRAKLVMITVKPEPEAGFEYIGPALNVIFAVGPLTNETDMILCGTAAQQLEELSKYCVLKPMLVGNDANQAKESLVEVTENSYV